MSPDGVFSIIRFIAPTNNFPSTAGRGAGERDVRVTVDARDIARIERNCEVKPTDDGMQRIAPAGLDFIIPDQQQRLRTLEKSVRRSHVIVSSPRHVDSTVVIRIDEREIPGKD